MPPEADHRTLVIDPSAGVRIVRMVGPSAWTVLEGIALRTTATSRGHQARTNVRELAVELGLSKDTVARAVNKLIDARIIRRSGFAQDEAGRFTTRTYRVDLDKAGLRVFHDRSQPDTWNRDKDVRRHVGTSEQSGSQPPPPPPPPPPPLRPVIRPLPPENTESRHAGRTTDDAASRATTSPAATTPAIGVQDDKQPTLFGNS